MEKSIKNALLAMAILTGFFNAHAQKIQYGVDMGFSLNTSTLTSNYKIDDQVFLNSLNDEAKFLEKTYNSGGIYFGAFTNYKWRNNLHIRARLNFHRNHLYTSPMVFTDQNNQHIGSYTMSIRNNNMRLEEILIYRFDLGFEVGLGLYSNYVFKSIALAPENMLNEEATALGKRNFENKNYKPFTMGTLFFIAYQYEKMGIHLKLNQGLSDKIKGDNLIKEYDTSISLGFSYYLN